MVLEAFGGSLGCIWGALGAFLGGPGDQTALVSFSALKSQRSSLIFEALLVALDALFSFLFFLLLSMSFLISSRSLLGPILSSQTDPPILKNVDFIIRISTFGRNQRFRSKNGFAIVFGLSRAPFGSSWGALGSSEGRF